VDPVVSTEVVGAVNPTSSNPAVGNHRRMASVVGPAACRVHTTVAPRRELRQRSTV
jgi:hypothetical protein